MGDANVLKLSKAFPVRTRILAPEKRSMTLEQLSCIYKYAETKCHEWELEPRALTTYHISEWMIEPATRANSTALAEHILEEEQPTGWFVSHWWGEPITLLRQSIRAHLSTRGLADKTTYWLCEFANCPHNSDYALENPKQSNIFKAMRTARFKVLLVIDAATSTSGPGTPFTRLWCGYELSLCADRSNAVVDIVTSNGSGSQVITWGLTAKEQTVEQYRPGDGTLLKIKREKLWPMEIIKGALDFAVQLAGTTTDFDKQAILNAIVGRRASAPILERHARYEEVNRKLRKLFALMFYRMILACDLPKSEHSRLLFNALQRQMTTTICQDVPCQSLSLCFAGTNIQDKQVKAMIQASYPTGLQALSLDFRCTDVKNETLREILEVLPPTLTELSLEVSGCGQISDDGIKEIVVKFPDKLKCMKLIALSTKVSPHMMYQVKDVAAFARKTLRKRGSALRDAQDVGDGNEVDEVTALEQLLNSRMTFELRKGIVDKLHALGREALC